MTKKYTVVFEISAQKALKKLDKYDAKIIMSWISKNLLNCADPRAHGKGLTENRSGEWRYRVGKYRIIANIADSTTTILILDVGHRKDIYK